MILVGLGSNLAGPWGSPRATVKRALGELDRNGSRVVAASPLVATEPFGRVNQPAFVNAVARIETHLSPDALMRRLHAIERSAGRKRGIRWGPRTLDLDLLDYRGLIRRGRLTLPHPGIAERIFVLAPIRDVVPHWRHPQTRRSARDMLIPLRGVKGGQIIDR